MKFIINFTLERIEYLFELLIITVNISWYMESLECIYIRYFNHRLTELQEQYQLLGFIASISHKYSDKHKFILDLMLLETPMLLVGPIQDDFKQFLREFISTNNLKGDLLELLYSLMVSLSCNDHE